MKEKKVYVIQEIAGSADGRPKINIMGASSYSTTNDFIFERKKFCKLHDKIQFKYIYIKINNNIYSGIKNIKNIN